jgi:hypothetical protein
MAEVRLTAMGRFTDYDVAVALFDRVSSVAAAVGGAAVWEAFADRETVFSSLTRPSHPKRHSFSMRMQ